ncbi:MAG: outer membrane beta-barrel protein [Thermodesulfobacteriota bacterium]
MLRKNMFAYALLLLLAVPLGFKSYDAHAASDQQIQELKQMIEQNQRENEQNRRQNELLSQKIEQLEAEKAANQAQVQESEAQMQKSVSKKSDNPIGAEFALTIGAQSGPFKTGTGFYMSGELGVPLMKNLGPGKLMGLINIGWAKTDDDITFEPTINAVAPGALPTQHTVDLTTLSIVLGFKYKVEAHNIVQPYILAGPSFNVFLNESDPGNQVGGIAPQPGTLQNRGYPSGQGNVELGIAAGGGVDFNITKKIFVGAEGRYNYVDRSNGSFGTYGGRLGFRF